MITELIQAIFAQFSLKILYMTSLWFAVIGYVMHMMTIMLLTHIPFKDLAQPIARLQVLAVLASFLISPICNALSSGLLHVLFPEFVIAQSLLIWFSLNMMLFSTYFLCSVFVSTSCRQFQSILILVEGLVGIAGYFVLKSF
ncbi:MAG TPA: hypothetical protein VLG50_04795 [Candidatus Saccharimonadales bacterium]|nr:hypothetical protein [Candidatus Saccharimonadales bacterium]